MLRIIIWVTSDPIIGNDTTGYAKVADYFAQQDFSEYRGDRTPVFPLVIMLNGSNYNHVLLTHFILGTLISLMIFYILILLGSKYWIAFIGGLLYSFHIPLIARELYMGTETVSVFLTVLLFLLFVLYHKQEKWQLGLFFLTGLLISLLILTRPAYLLLTPFIPVVLIAQDWFRHRKLNFQTVAWKFILYSVPVILLVGGWCAFNKIKLDRFTITTFKGYSLINSVGDMMVDAPDDLQPYKSMYLEKYYEHLEKEGKYYNAIHQSTEPLMDTLDITFWELSDKWEEIALDLIKKRPLEFAGKTVESFIRNWKPMGFYDTHYQLIIRIRQAQQLLIILVTLLFFAIPVIFWMVRKRDYFTIGEVLLIVHVFLISLGISAISAVVEYGDPRFSIPYLPLILLIVLFFYSRLLFVVKKVSPAGDTVISTDEPGKGSLH
ncbi:MAG: glycosyltransferase family 39 protein [Bacteroidales bacterium]|nr:glycosyltransferase family 39 protein [Bacteroidales bacterium]